MSDSQVTLRTRKFIRNPLLGRKQMVVCVQFPHQPAKTSSAASTAAALERRPERTEQPKRWNNVY